MSNNSFEFDLLKSAYLRESRGIGFEEIVILIETGKLLCVLPHPKQGKYGGQELYVVDVGGYVWLVPCIKRGNSIRLITCYPSRKETKKWLLTQRD